MLIDLPSDRILNESPRLSPATRGGIAIGQSRQERVMIGYRFGSGPLHVSLIAGCHADEPVGPAMLDRLAAYLATLPPEAPILQTATWRLIPHMNPDGEAANAGWSRLPTPEGGYQLASYLAGVVREAPGEDVEFGFPPAPKPGMAGAGSAAAGSARAEPRQENQAAARFLAEGGPVHLHISFHGMAFAAGPWFLLDALWVERSRLMRKRLKDRCQALGYSLHDVDRGGEKGFWRIAEGFTTRPDSRAMRDFFLARGEKATADLFLPSSMEYARSLGGDPLTLVSEMPLFLYPSAASAGDEAAREDDPPLPTAPEPARRFVSWAQELLLQQGPAALAKEVARLGVRPMPVGDQMRLQLALLEEGLHTVARYCAPSGP